MAVLFKAYRGNDGEIVFVKENSYADLNIGTLQRVSALDYITSTDEQSNETPPFSHTHQSSDITDLQAAIQGNAAVTANTAKRTYPLADESKLLGIEAGAKDDQNANEVPFDNTGSDITATDVEAAVKQARSLSADEITAHLGAADPHTQYHNDVRGDVRYYTKSALDAGQLDSRYYTETELLSGVLNGLYYTQAAADSLLAAKINTAAINSPNGVAGLDGNSKLSSSVLPALAISETFVVADIAARDSLVIGPGTGEIQRGDVAVVVDASADPQITSGGASYIYTGSIWQRLITPTDLVISVNGQTGAVVLTTSNVTEGTNLYYTDTRVSNNPDVVANTTHRGLTSGNPHQVDITEVVAASGTTDITEAELETLSDSSDASVLHNHNTDYFTKTELNGGQLDSRYYTETEVDSLVGSKVTGPVSSVSDNIALFEGLTGKLIKDSGISIIDEDDMISNSDTAVPTQQSVKTYVDSGVKWTVTQAAHGFSVVNNVPLPARLNGSSYELAQADDINTLSAFYITRIIDVNTFEVKQSGIQNAPTHGLTVGEYYYLSSSTAGAVTNIEPLTDIDDQVFYILDANTILLNDIRPIDRNSLEKFLIKATNVDVSTNINTAAFTAVPIVGSVEVNESSHYSVVSNTGITVPQTRSYKVIVNLHYTSTGARIALQGRFYINGAPVGAIVSTGYIRAANGHNEASLNIHEVFSIPAGQTIEFRVQRESTLTTNAVMVAGTSSIILEAR